MLWHFIQKKQYLETVLHSNLVSDKKIGVKNNHDVKNYITPEKEKNQADEVIDIEGNRLALS